MNLNEKEELKLIDSLEPQLNEYLSKKFKPVNPDKTLSRIESLSIFNLNYDNENSEFNSTIILTSTSVNLQVWLSFSDGNGETNAGYLLRISKIIADYNTEIKIYEIINVKDLSYEEI